MARIATMLQWLWCMWRVRRQYNDLSFSRRERFLIELRPKIGDARIAYPDALFWVKVADVDRALGSIGR